MGSAPDEIDAVPRPKVNAQFADPVSHRLDVAEIAVRQSSNAPEYLYPRLAIPQRAEPFRELVGLLNLDRQDMYTAIYDASTARPRESRASRIAPTRPSIMSEGTVTSAPARAWLSDCL